MTAPSRKNPHGVGARLPFVDGVEKVTGAARYTADLPAADALVGMLLRSPYAHAELLEVDISEALKLPGERASADDYHQIGRASCRERV